MNEEPPLLACDVQVGVHDYPFVVDDAEDVMSALAYSFIGRPLFLLQELEMRNNDNDDTDHRLSSRRDCGLSSLGYTIDLGPAPFANASHPKHEFEDSIIYGDYHAWVVDRNNVVHDYPTDQLQVGGFATSDIVRRPWDASLVSVALPRVASRSESDPIITRYRMSGDNCQFSTEELLKLVTAGRFPPWMCYRRAEILRDSNPNEFAIVLGSLGYRQNDGSIVWLCG